MKRFALLVACLALSACGKSVTRNGSAFFQTEDPNPQPSIPVPNPSPSPTPPGPVVCAPNALGDLLSYSAYITDYLKTDAVTLAKRAAAGTVCFQHGKVGNTLPNDAARVDLAAVGDLGVNKSKVLHGRATYGKTLDNVGSSAFGGFAKAPLDMRANIRKIGDFSEGCEKTPATAKIERKCKTATLAMTEIAMSPQTCTIRIIGQKTGLNVAEITAAELSNVTKFVIDIPAGADLVTNLPQNRIAVFRGVEVTFATRSQPSVGRIFWNFPAATAIELTGTKFRGTVVAPDAKVDVCGQDGESGVWARELEGRDSNW